MTISKELIQKHNNYVKYANALNEKLGLYWTKIQNDFNSVLTSEGWKNLGKQNFFPIRSSDLDLNEKEFKLKINSINLKNDNNNNVLINNYDFFKLLSEKYLKINTNKVLEIGAGCGILSSLIMSNYNKKYFIIDIPNMIINSSSYLMTIFPEKKFCLPNEINSSTNFEQSDIIFLLPSQKNILKENYFDLAINNQSFQEMDFSEIKDYFYLIKKTLKFDSFFFTSNRLRKESNFFDYPWYIFDNFQIKLFRKNKFHLTYNNSNTYLDKLLLKKDTKKKVYNLNLFKKLILKNSYSLSERLFWLKKDLLAVIKKLIFYYK